MNVDDNTPVAPVIKLDPSKPPIQSKRSLERCYHRQITVNPHAREVSCQLCGAVLDPIDALMMYARAGDRIVWMNQERKSLEKQIDNLKAEERRVKARIRSAKKRDSATREKRQ